MKKQFFFEASRLKTNTKTGRGKCQSHTPCRCHKQSRKCTGLCSCTTCLNMYGKADWLLRLHHRRSLYCMFHSCLLFSQVEPYKSCYGKTLLLTTICCQFVSRVWLRVIVVVVEANRLISNVVVVVVPCSCSSSSSLRVSLVAETTAFQWVHSQQRATD